MTFEHWIPALSTTALLGGVLWLCKNLIATRLRASVKHEFDVKLDELRATLRKSEELFRADLQAKENQLGALRGSAIAGLVNRQAVFDKRRLEAVDQIWTSLNSLASAKIAAKLLSGVKFEALAKEAAKNEGLRKVFESMSAPLDQYKNVHSESSRSRPFISDIAWAFFSAYQAIVMAAALKMQMLKSGLDAPDMLDEKSIAKLIKAALPHQAALIDQYGPCAYHLVLDELEAKLLTELRRILRGEEMDRAGVEQAAAILKASEDAVAQVFKANENSGGRAA